MGKGKGKGKKNFGRSIFKSNPERVNRHHAATERIWGKFSPDELGRVCQMDETTFPAVYGMETVKVDQRAPNDWYAFRDNGSDILAVAHLDTVADADARQARFMNTEAGWVCYSRALDDRLGAYTILELLPKLGLNFDILLTVGEEQGASTAEFFEPLLHKNYRWLIEFDRGGTDVVLYQYKNDDLVDLVEDSGARVGVGSFSDISYMSHVGAKGFNWGVGYEDYHGPKAHFFVDDYVRMIGYFLEFHRVNQNVSLPHDLKDEDWGYGKKSGNSGSYTLGGSYKVGGGWLDDDEDDDERFDKWLKDHAQYSPNATAPGVPTAKILGQVQEHDYELVKEAVAADAERSRIAAAEDVKEVIAAADAQSYTPPLPGV